MAKYDEQGEVTGVALGEYKPEDVKIFRQDGYVSVSETEAKRLSGILSKNLDRSMRG